MAQCKYCHQQITRIDKEVCPFCGGKRPLDGTDTSTQDVTKVIGQLEHAVEIKHKKRIIAALLAIFFGLFGAPHFYLGKPKVIVNLDLIHYILIINTKKVFNFKLLFFLILFLNIIGR